MKMTDFSANSFQGVSNGNGFLDAIRAKLLVLVLG
jgi:hypothetical protein